jgi:cyanophycin synthetase
VVKPADLDGGQGVTAWLTTPAEVRTAYAAAAALSAQVLVEKHFFGNDYRLQVFQGEVYWAVQRVPAGVTGDGVQSVQALLKAANADPRRGGEAASRLKWIAVDEEALMWLARQALSLEAIPEKDCFVRLRGAANVASGGTTEPVLELAHPDNLALAARAANVLRLDMAGVDLLIPDIRRSWRESGAAICEVNSQPQMAAHLPALLLPRLVAGEGRIPVLVVLGGERDTSAFSTLLQGLAGVETGFGLAAADGAWVNDMQVANGPLSSFQAARCLIADPAVTMLVLHATDPSMLRTGCPFDRIDHLVLAGPLRKDGEADWHASRLLATWLADVAGKVWLLDAAPEWQHARLRQAGLPQHCADVRELLAHVIQTREA